MKKIAGLLVASLLLTGCLGFGGGDVNVQFGELGGKTYNNPEIGIRFNYPATFILVEPSKLTPNTLIGLIDLENLSSDFTPNIALTVEPLLADIEVNSRNVGRAYINIAQKKVLDYKKIQVEDINYTFLTGGSGQTFLHTYNATLEGETRHFMQAYYSLPSKKLIATLTVVSPEEPSSDVRNIYKKVLNSVIISE